MDAHAANCDAAMQGGLYVQKQETGRFFFDYPLAAFSYRRSLVEAGCEATLPYV
ncbi:hypothetical protein OKW43_000780 [Paraburkholderia sp. WC7.3g]|uniref:hypothetical protein n=1 Tax=Paraburkholderia TaxID=1822464 RepID=UPI00165511CB|nr:hypothetical protein [Paraburkholderia podalyriae]